MAALTRSDLRRLTSQERLALISELWDSLSDEETPLTPAQEAELERRLAASESDRDHSVSWEQLKTELRQRRS
jgi:putative addiction module component (TIGR02574 family)